MRHEHAGTTNGPWTTRMESRTSCCSNTIPCTTSARNTRLETFTQCKNTTRKDTGVLPLISASFWTSSLGKWLANTRLFYNIGFSEAKALFRQMLARKWGYAIARGWATLLLDRLRDFVVVPSSAGGNSSFELHCRSTEERATSDRYHHFHGHSGMCA